MLGHVQRGGTPNAYDRVLSTRYGLAAIHAVHEKQWGQMVIYKDHRMALAPLSTAVGQTCTVDTTMYRVLLRSSDYGVLRMTVPADDGSCG